jgi:hypothetical protein
MREATKDVVKERLLLKEDAKQAVEGEAERRTKVRSEVLS